MAATPSRPGRTFVVLPFVQSQSASALAVGEFRLWRNTPTDWKREAAVDNTAFVEMYREEQGDPVADRASILAKPELVRASFEEIRDAVYCLSTAGWLAGAGSRAADSWVFEPWDAENLPTDGWFRRSSKFSVNVTSAEIDRVYPTPYTSRVYVNDHWSPILGRLTNELRRPREESILSALGHFHLARFNTPYFTSPGDDIEALWSGFESLFLADRGTVEQGEAASCRLGSVIPWPRLRRTVNVLLHPIPPRIDKADRLVLAIRRELSARAMRPEFWEGVAKWAGRLYELRNLHSHGARTEVLIRPIGPYGRDPYWLGLAIAENLLHLRFAGGMTWREATFVQRLNYLFLEVPAVSRLVRNLKALDRKAWFPGVPAPPTSTVEDVVSDLHVLEDLPDIDRRYVNYAGIDDARKKIGLSLSKWVEDLLANPPSGIQLHPVANVPGLIAWLDRLGKSGAEIDTAVARSLVQAGAHRPDPYGGGDLPALHGGRIPITLWVIGYIRLAELSQGYWLR